MVAQSEFRRRGAGPFEASTPRPTSSTMHSGREAKKAFEMLNAVKKAEELPTSELDWWTPVFTIGSMALSIGNQMLAVGSGGMAFLTNTASTNKKFDLAMLEREQVDLNVKLWRLTGEKNQAAFLENQAAMQENQAAMQVTMQENQAAMQATMAAMQENQAVVLQVLRGLQQQVGQQQVGQPQQVVQQQVGQQQVGQQQVGQPQQVVQQQVGQQQVGQQQVGQLHQPAATIDRDIHIIKNAILEVKSEIDTLLGKEPQPGAPKGYRDLAAAIV